MICSRCGQSKNDSDFSWKNKSKNQKQSACKPCCRESQKRHYLKFPRKRSKTDVDKRLHRINKNTQLIIDYKKTNPCIECGENNPIFLDFDHIRDKKYNVSNMLEMSHELIMEEISKCVIRCVFCHRLKTLKDINWIGFELINEDGSWKEN